ncbi:hypothetical protein [Natronincola ferrireducens]|uniref:Uncharacterized protein n=1 Tax=Natronincola ferrireducens TaxID=393762 RepID=A0A1G9CW50_9FIRM|nr:hypothetical protein [Natronincola ferrireducens]SDK55896.1 hypothetical protein SAMN05660472_01572 [Natronincola ferrireducens]
MGKEKDYKYGIKDRNYINIELEDFLEMNYQGLSEQELARELGISSKEVNKLKQELQKDYQ